MANQIQKIQSTFKYAMENRPKIGGFPFLAECMRQSGVSYNIWSLPSAQSIYVMDEGSVVQQGNPLVSGLVDIAVFDQESLVKAIRKDQIGESTFDEFLKSCWEAGVVRYVVDFEKRMVSYFGVNEESYEEEYGGVEIGVVSSLQ